VLRAGKITVKGPTGRGDSVRFQRGGGLSRSSWGAKGSWE